MAICCFRMRAQNFEFIIGANESCAHAQPRAQSWLGLYLTYSSYWCVQLPSSWLALFACECFCAASAVAGACAVGTNAMGGWRISALAHTQTGAQTGMAAHGQLLWPLLTET